ncbi:hypothetical protein Cgig2_033877 [Carnegiea gigantea]|uniref:TF-B3 domain-containing protein n=1 Tax=Carnegiea gigantea TaxID=171969 RepID=A0A9Q1JXX7_9CARY|nr:hypothetical protein Cgig2_033877 [Carnegiea gigantea]
MATNSDAFFQPLLPNFLNSFSIPVAYLKKLEAELKGHQLESVVLMREKDGHRHKHENKHWVVEIQGGRHFNPQEWSKFALHHELKEGCFLVFRHSGNLLFHVSVFDPITSCECHFLSHPEQEKQEEERQEKQEERSGGGVAVPSRRGEHRPPPKCYVTITSYSAERNIIHLPRQFVRANGLAFRRCIVTLIDQKKRSWKVWLSYKDSDGQSYINRGWKAFQVANPLKPGDVIRLQLLNPGTYPIFKCCSTWIEVGVYSSRSKPELNNLDRFVSSHSGSDSANFVKYLPRKFVRENGLAFRRCAVKLIDQKKRSWKVWLHYKHSNEQSYINRGWKAFGVANRLKPGDVIRFQLLDAGKRPVFKCCTCPKPWEGGRGEEEDDKDKGENDDDVGDDEAENEVAEVAYRRRPGQRTPPSCHFTITPSAADRSFDVSQPMSISSCLAPKSWKTCGINSTLGIHLKACPLHVHDASHSAPPALTPTQRPPK